jgi:hypothetical protein
MRRDVIILAGIFYFCISILNSPILSMRFSLYYYTLKDVICGNYQEAYESGDFYSDGYVGDMRKPLGLTLLERKIWFSYLTTLVKLKAGDEQVSILIQQEVACYSFNIEREIKTYIDISQNLGAMDSVNKKKFLALLNTLQLTILSELGMDTSYKIYEKGLITKIPIQNGVKHRLWYPSTADQEKEFSSGIKIYPFWGHAFNERILALKGKIKSINISDTSYDEKIITIINDIHIAFQNMVNNQDIDKLFNFYRYLVEGKMIWFHDLVSQSNLWFE